MTTARWNAPVLACFALAALVMSGTAHADGDSAAGKKVFRKCVACHTVQVDKHRIGPSLAGIAGRTAGTTEGFKFSDAMKAFGADGKVWDDATLDAYLADPKGVVKGTKMAFAGLKDAQDRADVIAYLKAANGE
ncbi:cytochrome c family protein [Thalassobaculum sp.]|uniref:c-type cytochrome n=1 Tax=Thalassobaculum sp. TaxID=2022740 RepID=UPI0032F0609C